MTPRRSPEENPGENPGDRGGTSPGPDGSSGEMSDEAALRIARDPGVRWMLAFQGGDEAAFDRLVERYSAPVWGLLTRFLGQDDRREDLTQEVFLRLLRTRESYRPRARLSTLLYRIAFNLCVNEREREQHRRSESLERREEAERGGTEAAAQWRDEAAPAPSAGLERDDIVRTVRGAIAALPERQRMALLLTQYEGQTLAEVGAVLDVSDKAAKSLVHRARERLRSVLAPLLTEEPA